jgi:hypothetical protein
VPANLEIPLFISPYRQERAAEERQLRQARALFGIPVPALSLYGGAPQGITGAVDRYGLPIGPAGSLVDGPDPRRSLENYKQIVDDRERYFRDESQRTFELIKSQSGELFDAMIAGGDRFWDFFRNAGLTVVKDIFSGAVATTLTGAFGGRSPAQALGLAGIGFPGAPGGTSGFAGPVAGAVGRSGGLFGSASLAGLGGFAPALAAGVGASSLGLPRPLRAGLTGGSVIAGGVIGGAALGGAGLASFAALGAFLSNPVGAVVLGGAVGIPALIGLFTSSAKDKAKEKVKDIYGVTISDKGILEQIVGIGKSYAGGNLDLAVRMPMVQELVYLYSMATGSGGNASLIGGNFPRNVSIVQRMGQAFLQPQYLNATPYTYASSLPTAPVSMGRQVNQIILSPGETRQLWKEGMAEGISENPQLVMKSNLRGLQHSGSRRDSFATQAEPYAVTS